MSRELLELMGVSLRLGDCIDVMRGMPDASVDSIVTDPPYELGFMGKGWDKSGIANNVEMWAEALRVLKPGGHLLAFSGTRTYHRMVCAIEDAGFEVRDQIGWAYGSGFPKSLDVSKAIDKRGGAQVAWFGPWFRKWREDNSVTQRQVAALFPSKTGGLTGCVANWELGFNMPTPEQFNLIRDTFGLPFASVEEAEREVVGQQWGTTFAVAPGQDNDRSATTLDITAPATDAARQWQGWGTALKPAWEPICVARKPLIGTVAENVLAHGTGALNIDGCRVGTETRTNSSKPRAERTGFVEGFVGGTKSEVHDHGRWPANIIHDGSDEVLAAFPQTAPSSATLHAGSERGSQFGQIVSSARTTGYSDAGSAARFYYCAKASKSDRGGGNVHATVKPTELMRYLSRLVTPPGGVVLDPFMGSGSTGKGAILEGFQFIGIDMTPEYVAIAEARCLGALK